MKTIGILGGLGPQATMDFEMRIHQVAQRLIPPQGNSGYPPMIVYYQRQLPFVMSDPRTPVFPLQVDTVLFEAAEWLGTKVDFLVIPANGPHMAQNQIEQAAGCKVLSMIDVTLAEIQRRGWRKIGVLGFGDPRVPVYTQPLGQLNLVYELIGIELQTQLNEAVLEVMEGHDNIGSSAIAHQALATLRARDVDGIILGCTEIPLLLHEDVNKPDLVNPAQLLAEAAVKYALSNQS